VTSPAILEEVAEVINREKLVKLLKMTSDERNDFMNMLIERSGVTEGKRLSYVIGRDEKDDKFLACGVEGKAGYIVTGDRDLLVFNEFEGVKIVTPREFLNVLMY
jgi:putative PIN family toxin of toxin-antitoxin system